MGGRARAFLGSTVGRIIAGIFLAVLLMGTVLVVNGALAGAHPTPPPTSFQQTALEIDGTLAVPTAFDPDHDRLSLVFHFPEIPLDLDRDAAGLALQPDGSYHLQISFETRHAPRYFEITASGRGLEPLAVPAIPIMGGQCHVPPIALRERQTF